MVHKTRNQVVPTACNSGSRKRQTTSWLLSANRLLSAISVITLLSFAGCENSDQATNTQRNPVNVPGIAPAGGLDELQKSPSKSTPTSKSKPTTAANSKPQESAKPKVTASRKGILGKTTAKVVDAKKAKQNPKVVEVENKISGFDPVSIAASAYIAISSRVSLLSFKSSLKQYKALNEKAPSYDEFLKMTQQHRIEFAKLPPYQMYGYDETTGGLVILEDKAEKIRLYKNANIPLDEADKKFDDAS